MNKRQKQVQERFLNDEKAVIKELNKVYGNSLIDINAKIQNLTFKIGKLEEEYDWLEPDDPKKAQVKSMIQSKIYQKQYQEQLQKQVSGIYDKLLTRNYTTVADYLDDCYTDGFIGTIFDAHGQGVPIIAPINQEAMVKAVQLESKISKGLYTRLGEDVDLLKQKITAQVSRAIATGMTYEQTAKQLENYSKIGYNNAVRIARTEGHRIQITATMDAMQTAKNKGADVVKQWDATLDDKTRESHAQVDGEIRELKEKFSNGLNYPGDPSGGAAEVVNCRCALHQRARWALDKGELQTLQDRAAYFGLDKSKEFDDFKKKYLNAVETPDVVDINSIRNDLKALNSNISTLNKELGRAKYRLSSAVDKDAVNKEIDDIRNRIDALKSQITAKGKLLVENLNTTFKVSTNNEKFINMVVKLDSRIEYKEVMKLVSGRSVDEIISVLAGGDTTSGSCASVGLGYIGQKNGWDVLDFRGGTSMEWFSSKANKLDMWDSLGIKYITEDSAKTNITNGKRILSKIEQGKEYYLSVGRHAAIVRKNDSGVVQYLELQHGSNNGWRSMYDVGEVLKRRFGCSSSSGDYATAYLTDIDAVKDNNEFRTILGYINTSESEQRKGLSGTIK